MERKFGIELEIVGITQDAAIKALKAVQIKVNAEGYNHTTRNYWKIVPDGSVTNCFEVVSPILKGEAGIEEAEIVARALEDAGAYANRTCGFHVHFDASDLGMEHIKKIVRRYAAHEQEIDAFMPKSRRGNSNQYCQSLNGILGHAFDSATTTQALVSSQPSRYYKVNLKSYQRHGTIEFRQHSGTVNAMKVCTWIRFLAEFIDECGREAGDTAPMQPAETLSPVNRRLVALLENGAVTLDEICQNFGWLAHTGRAAIARLRKTGMKIVSQKIDGQTGYRLETQNATTDRLWNGISRKVALFYQRRAAVLATAA